MSKRNSHVVSKNHLILYTNVVCMQYFTVASAAVLYKSEIVDARESNTGEELALPSTVGKHCGKKTHLDTVIWSAISE